MRVERISWQKEIRIELAVWHFIPTVFLAVYCLYFGAPAAAAALHLGVIFLAYCALTALRIWLRFMHTSEALMRVISSLLLASWSFFLVTFYGLSLQWIGTIGRLFNWEMLYGFLLQIPFYADALDVPDAALVASTAFLFLVFFGCAWRYFGAHDWTRDALRDLQPLRSAFAAGVFSAATATLASTLVISLPVEKLEPLSVTFRSGGISPLVNPSQGKVASSPELSAAEITALESYRPNASANRRNLVFILVDTLRPDHMGVYGYYRETTPNLTRMMTAEAGRRVDGLRAVCGQSDCAIRGLLSSKYVHQFTPRMFNLTDVMRKHGYKIHMLLSGDHTNYYGLRESYGEPDTYIDGSMAARDGHYANGDQFVAQGLREIPSFDGTPSFFQFHLMTTHPFGAHSSRTQTFLPAKAYGMPWDRKSLGDPAAKLETAVNFYDNAVLETDEMIEKLISILRGKGYLRDTLVVVTSDHGESLGEHGTYSHAQNAREQALRIPLLLFSFGGHPIAPFDEQRAGSQVDIAPTLIAELNMLQPPTWVGIPLQQRTDRRFIYFQERNEVGLIDRAFVGKRWKYWQNVQTGQEFAFSIDDDPGELRNLFPGISEDLRKEWRQQLQRTGSDAHHSGMRIPDHLSSAR